MKKLLMLLVCLCTLGMVSVNALETPEKTDHELVTIYMFRGSGCSHCYDALDYFTDMMDEYPVLGEFIDFEIIEVWENESNNTLANAVASEFGEELGGVPYIVIGNAYHEAGFAESIGEDILQTALDEYANDNYVDVVSNIINNANYDVTIDSLTEAAEAEGIIVDDYDYDDYDYDDYDYDDYDDYDDVLFEADEDGFFALGVASILLIISVAFNFITLPLFIVFLVLYIKEKNKNKKKN